MSDCVRPGPGMWAGADPQPTELRSTVSSRFSISESDLTPDPIPETTWDELTDDDGDGVADVDVDAVIVSRENEFVSAMGGMLTDDDNIALAKPQVVFVIVYGLHFRRAQIADYKVPDGVRDAYKSALRWARDDGKRLLESEGFSTAPSGGVDYIAPTAAFKQTQTGYL